MTTLPKHDQNDCSKLKTTDKTDSLILGKGFHPIVSRVGRAAGRLADKQGFKD